MEPIMRGKSALIQGGASAAPTAVSRRTAALSHLAREPDHLRLLRPSLGIKAGVGGWFFTQGEVLRGVLVTHRANTSRKVIIRTDRGVFNLNEEDVEEV